MKAALFLERDADLVIRDDITLGDVGPKDVRVKIGSSGVCHSDLSVMNGTIPQPPPTILGHELIVNTPHAFLPPSLRFDCCRVVKDEDR